MSRESVVGLVVLGVLLVLVVAVAVLGVVARRARRGTQDALLRDLGWEGAPPEDALLDRWRGAPFDVQDRGRVEDLRRGTFEGRPLTTFRYAWRSAATMAGRGRPTMVECQVVALDAPWDVPTVEVVPVGYRQPSVQRVVGREVVFDEPAFAAAWTVRAPDELAAHELLTARVRQELLAPAYAGTRLRFESGALLSWTDGPAPVEDVRDLALLLAGVLGHVGAPGRPEGEDARPAQAPDR
ncbi:hypothetical protein EQW78_12045 [Oerskovia turbata]|uniref:DUF3137 domain-containing protein n=1 Tax=Oerskovia turbata TaxID=1713 RepID=A0A4Q1KSW5_9CELL|nr:hypothetical protein [Oerskovia turbata]RXR25701.1 hypothetical protein EQW73_09300 [Oerskovia turbata]RXR33211.1 hypothetical protein EQW78_12045 [Oerskovia turbata]TGJ96283.1 hypothetical protein DLJ96_11140 [Actinotalea fermentans ATCC 43279 = JCM 9966 = DSM 3133]